EVGAVGLLQFPDMVEERFEHFEVVLEWGKALDDILVVFVLFGPEMFLAKLTLATAPLVILAELVHLAADTLFGQALKLGHLALLAQDEVLELLHLGDGATADVDLLGEVLHTFVSLGDDGLLLVDRLLPAGEHLLTVDDHDARP